MLASQIDDLIARVSAIAACPELPEHIRSLAATVGRMAVAVAADPAPARVDIFTLEQAVRILDRWVADHHATTAVLPGKATFDLPVLIPTL